MYYNVAIECTVLDSNWLVLKEKERGVEDVRLVSWILILNVTCFMKLEGIVCFVELVYAIGLHEW